MIRSHRLGGTLIVLVLTGACAPQGERSAGTSPSASRAAASSPSSAMTSEPTQPRCPNPHGGICRGDLEVGTYSTEIFSPKLTYAVPAGWANLEDLPGNFLLVPPGGDLEGVDAGTSDYVGIYTSVRVGLDCKGRTATGVGRTPGEIAQWMGKHPSLAATKPRSVSVSGLEGLRLDVSVPRPLKPCMAVEGFPVVPLLAGIAPSDFEHVIFQSLTIRLYLLPYKGGTLGIEINDLHEGKHLDEMSAVVEKLVVEAA